MITRLRLRLMALMTILVLPMAAMTITANEAPPRTVEFGG
jgi:hypothetical protein